MAKALRRPTYAIKVTDRAEPMVWAGHDGKPKRFLNSPAAYAEADEVFGTPGPWQVVDYCEAKSLPVAPRW